MALGASYCRFCGTKVEPDSRFCSHCGKQTSTATGEAPTALSEREIAYYKKEEEERLKRLAEANRLAEKYSREEEREKRRLKKVGPYKSWLRASMFFYIFGIFTAFLGLLAAGGVGAIAAGVPFLIIGWLCGKKADRIKYE